MKAAQKSSAYSSMDLVRAAGRASAADCASPVPTLGCALQVGIVSTLESHWVVLDAELSEIRKDYAALRTVCPSLRPSAVPSGAQRLRCGGGSSLASMASFGTAH